MKNKSSKPNISKVKKLNPKVAKLKGVISLPPDFDYKKAVGECLLEKYNKLK